MVTHICISMALRLSPRKYFSGKFCFKRLKSDSMLQRLRYVSHTCSADISSGSSTLVTNWMVSLPSSVRLTILRQRYVPCTRSFTVTTPEFGLGHDDASVPRLSWDARPMDSPWTSPGQNIGVGSLSLLQGIFPTQGSNPGLQHCRRILYQLSHKSSNTAYIILPHSLLFAIPPAPHNGPSKQIVRIL